MDESMVASLIAFGLLAFVGGMAWWIYKTNKGTSNQVHATMKPFPPLIRQNSETFMERRARIFNDLPPVGQARVLKERSDGKKLLAVAFYIVLSIIMLIVFPPGLIIALVIRLIWYAKQAIQFPEK